MTISDEEKVYGEITRTYQEKSVKKRIEAFLLDNPRFVALWWNSENTLHSSNSFREQTLIERTEGDNIGKIVTREQILEVARDPVTGKEPENWHQRLSELRTDDGYTVLSWRNRGDLKVQEYLLPHANKRSNAAKRVCPTDATWLAVLERANYACEWSEGGDLCQLKVGEIDPVGDGRVKLSHDHKTPHALNPDADPRDPNQWQVLCSRHQVVKKNYWDHLTGKLNAYAIVQAATKSEKQAIFAFLLEYFGYILNDDSTIAKR